MKKLLVALSAALALSACKKDEAKPAEAAPANTGSPAAAAKPAEPAKPADPAAGAARIQGAWNLDTGDAEVKRTLELTRVALKTPKPTEKELADLKLTKDEQAMVEEIQKGGESQAEAKKMLEQFDAATITFTADKVVMALDETPDEAPYTVKSVEGNTVVLHTTPPNHPEEDLTLKIVDADTLEMYADGDPEKMILRRKK